jgi:GTP-binding nuclear protein Ran
MNFFFGKPKALPAASGAWSSVLTFKVVIVGDGGVGKTTLCRRLKEGTFETRYIATMGVDVTPLRFETTTHGPLVFNCWDCAGQEKFGGLRDGYYIRGEAAIVVVDASSCPGKAESWLRDVRRVCDSIPIVLVLAKSELGAHNTNIALVAAAEQCGAQYCEVSAKRGENLQLPFLLLARALTKAPELSFVPSTS